MELLAKNKRSRGSSTREGSTEQDLQWATEFLGDLVAIDSITTNASGVEKVQQKVAAQLAEMGFVVSWYTQAQLPYGPLLKAEIPGSSPQYITLVAHADTVLSPRPFHRTDDQRAVGSGVIDNKGGLTVLLLGLKLLLRKKQGFPYGLRVISSPNEEVGSVGFLDHLREATEDTVLALGFEPALENGSIIASRRGNRWYHLRVLGKEAHAGRSYGEHVNAAHELAGMIHELQRLTHYKKNLSVNVGALSGGRDKFNIVCGHAEAKIDVRFADFKRRDRLHRKIEKIFNKKRHPSICGRFQPESSWQIVDDCPPFATTRISKKLIAKYLDIVSAIEGHPVEAESAGGAGDVNYLSRENIAVIDGLGPIGGHMHTQDEFIYLPSLQTRALALSQFLSAFMKRR